MNREETIQKILQLAEGSPLKHMFTSMPWWNNWSAISDPGLEKVLETLEWHRSEIESMVKEAISTNPEAHNKAYGMVREADRAKLEQEEAMDDGAWSSDQLLQQI